MNVHREFAWITLALSLILAGNTMALAAERPSGTLVIDEVQVMAIIGGDVGGGTLLKGDRSYSFKADGIKIGGVGIQKIHLVGDVYRLKSVKDFPGVYVAAEAGIAVVKGKTGIWLKNDKGVYIHLHGNAEGIALGLGVEGLKIRME